LELIAYEGISESDHLIGTDNKNLFRRNRNHISASDINTNSKLWSKELDFSIQDGIVRPNNNLFLVSEYAYILEGKSGLILAQAPFSRLSYSLLEDDYDKKAWMPRYYHGFLNLDDLTLLTEFELKNKLKSTAFAIKGDVALFDLEKGIAAFDLRTKKRLWEKVDYWFTYSAPSLPVVIAGKTLFDKDEKARFQFTAFDLRTGEKFWDWDWERGVRDRRFRGETGSYKEKQNQLIYNDTSGFYIIETESRVDIGRIAHTAHKDIIITKRHPQKGSVMWDKTFDAGDYQTTKYDHIDGIPLSARGLASSRDNVLAWWDEKYLVMVNNFGVRVIDSRTGNMLDQAALIIRIHDPGDLIKDHSGKFDRRKVIANNRFVFIGLDEHLISLDRLDGRLTLEKYYKKSDYVPFQEYKFRTGEYIEELVLANDILGVRTHLHDESSHSYRLYRYQVRNSQI